MNKTFGKLLKMKDTSELMVDLSYSALLFNDKEIAEEVYNLEKYIDALYQKIVRFALTSMAKENLEMAMFLIRLSTSIEAIADCAMEIADVVLRDIEPHPVVKMSIEDSDSAIFKVKIKPDSLFCDKTIGSVGVAAEIGMWIVAIRRDRKWKFGPNENTVMRDGDILIARGPPAGKKKFKKMAKGKIREL